MTKYIDLTKPKEITMKISKQKNEKENIIRRNINKY